RASRCSPSSTAAGTSRSRSSSTRRSGSKAPARRSSTSGTRGPSPGRRSRARSRSRSSAGSAADRGSTAAFASRTPRSATARSGSSRRARPMRTPRSSRSPPLPRSPTTCAPAARSRATDVAVATIDGIRTRYEVIGSGPPLLMYSPAGFDATLDKWTTQGVYARIRLLDHLPKRYTCIVFDRRETGQSGGRVERIGWNDYVAQGRGLLDHLGFDRAHLLGGCMGCCPVAAFAVAHPERVLSTILYWPVGGAKYRISTHKRFADHLAYVDERGLAGVVELVKTEGKPFNAEPRGGPWASVIRTDPAFAAAYAKL